MCTSMQCLNLSNDLAAYIHPCSTFIIDRLFISAYAVFDRSTHGNASGIHNKNYISEDAMFPYSKYYILNVFSLIESAQG